METNNLKADLVTSTGKIMKPVISQSKSSMNQILGSPQQVNDNTYTLYAHQQRKYSKPETGVRQQIDTMLSRPGILTSPIREDAAQSHLSNDYKQAPHLLIPYDPYESPPRKQTKLEDKRHSYAIQTNNSMPNTRHHASSEIQPRNTKADQLIKQSPQPRSPSNFDIQPDQHNKSSVLMASPEPFTSKKSQIQEYGMHGFKQQTVVKQNELRIGKTKNMKGDLVQVSVLFNVKQEQPAVITTQVMQQLKCKGINVLLPNLNQNQRHRDNTSNSALMQSGAGSAVGRTSQTSLQQQLVEDFNFTDLNYANTAKKAVNEIDQSFSMVRGLQNIDEEIESKERLGKRRSQIIEEIAKKAFEHNYRKGSHAVTRDQDKALQAANFFSSSITPKNAPPRINNKIQSVQSYGELPRIIVQSTKKKKKEINGLGQSKDERVGYAAVVGTPSNYNSPQAFQQQANQQTADLYGVEFKQWLTPNFQMQGKGILEQQNYNFLSQHKNNEIIQKIRQQSVMGVQQNPALTTSCQPQSPTSLSTRKEDSALRNVVINSTLGAKVDENLNHHPNSTHVKKTVSRHEDRPQSKLHQKQLSQNQSKSRSGNYGSSTTVDKSKPIVGGPSRERPPMPPSTSGSFKMNNTGGSRFRQNRKTPAASGTASQASRSRQGSSVSNQRGRTSCQNKQEEQIKSSGQDQQEFVQEAHMEQNNSRAAAVHNSGTEPSVISRSQLNSMLEQVNQTEDGKIHDPASYDANSPVIRKDSQKNNNFSKSVARPTETTGKKPGGAVSQVRQVSQAQRNNRNSLVGNPKGRHINTGKDGPTGNRQVVLNSPLMQPPPQILQSKIIIHLLRTEYPLIEQVAKQDMLWRVTKSENPNQEFDIYWNDIGIDSDRLASLKPYQKANHFPAMYQITRKTFLAKNLKRLQKLYPLEFDFFPKTWVLPNELNELRTYATEKAKKPKSPKKLLPIKTASSEVVSPPQTGTAVENPKFSRNVDEMAKNMMYNSSTATAPAMVEQTNKETEAGESESSEDENDDEDDEDKDESGDTEEIVKEPITQTATPVPSSMNVGAQRRIGEHRAQRKGATICKMSKKSRFPMIVKPDCMSQGKGIFLTHDIDSIPREETFVVQQYMQKPYLMDGLKFDLRLYVLILSCEPLKIFLYEEGLVRFATHQYQPLSPNAGKDQLNNLYMHLTNYAVNKENADFKMAKGMNDDTSHKRTLKKVLERLKDDGLDTEKIMGEIKDVIVKTLITIQQELAHNYRTCQPADLENLMCFEILGFDIILDELGKPILLEVNQAPSFATDSPLDYEIKKGLFVDTFRLLGLSVEKKKAKLRRLYEEKKDRMLTKLTLKQKNLQRRQAINEFKKEQESFEAANNGRFEKIYPLPVKEAAESNLLAQENVKMTQSQKQLAQSQYQALVRQQERYCQLLGTIGNTDIEKAIRAKNRQDEIKSKDMKEKETKLKLKKEARKRIDVQVTHARQTSQQNKKGSLTPGDIVAGALIKPEESIEQAMRESIMKPPGNLETQSLDSKLRQSIGERLTDNKSQTTHSKTKEFVQQNSHMTPMHVGHGMSQNFALKHPSQQYTSSNERQVNLRESVNGAPLDQNLQIRHLIEMQQKMANGVSGTKTTTFNLVNFGIQQLQQQNAQSLTGRQQQNKKPMMISDYIGGPQMIEGLKPNITQLHYQNNISQSQNPINPQKLKSGEFEMKMHRTTGQNNRHPQNHKVANTNMQTNLLPSIAKNMILAEKTSQGFSSQQTPQGNNPTQPHQQMAVMGNNEYARGSSKNRQRFRGSAGHHSAATQQSSAGSAHQVNPTKHANVTNQNPHPASGKRHDRQSSEVVSLQTTSAQNTPGMSSPKRQGIIERSQFQRSSIQQANGQIPLAMKTQTMNLGVINIQPVIIDSNHFNTENLQNHNQNNVNNQSLTSPTKHIPISGGSSYKTQKFSKIQLQAIIDNLYQYEGKGQKPKGVGQVSATPKDLSKTINLKNGPTVIPPHLMHLPEVNLNDNIHKSSNLANRALNAIAQQKASAAIQANVIGLAENQTPQRLGSSGQVKSAESSSPLKDQMKASDQGRFATHRNDVASNLNSPGRNKPVMSPKRSTGGGVFAVQGQSYQQQQQQTTQQQPQPENNGQQLSPSTTTNVLNFSNCNVTIINNNGSSSIYEGNPGQTGATIIQSSLISRPLNAGSTNPATPANNSSSPTKSGKSNQLSQIQEVPSAPNKEGLGNNRSGDGN